MSSAAPLETALVADLGNSRVALGLWNADGLQRVTRHDVLDESDWRDKLAILTRTEPRPRTLVVSSVNPARLSTLESIAREQGLTPLVIRRDLPLPLRLEGVEPETVGTDRICCAAAAFERVHTACVAASFGSAITIDLISEQGTFLGGTILPGLNMSLRALHDYTAALPQIVLGPPPADAAGRNTEEAMLSGVVYGAIGALREIVERYATRLGKWPPLVVSGGNALLLQQHADFIDAVVPDLCLMGAVLALQRGAPGLK